MRKRMQEAWLSYREAVIPADARSAQLIECRRAFYAGAQSFFTTVMTALEPGSEETEADLSLMADLEAELGDFNEQVKKGLA